MKHRNKLIAAFGIAILFLGGLFGMAEAIEGTTLHLAETGGLPADPGVPLVVVFGLSTADVAGWLKRRYATKSYFEPYQNDLVPMLKDLNECPDEAPEGSGWFVPLYIASSQNWRAGAEGGPSSDVVASTEVQGQVNAQEYKGTVQLSEFLRKAGSAAGHFNGGHLAHQMKMITTDMMKAMQRFIWLGHGTGRMAVVDADEVGTNTAKLRLPISWHGLAVNMRIDFVNLDTGGAVQVSNRRITAIDKQSFGITGAGTVNTYKGIITYSGAAANLTAGWGIYRSGDYGANITNGIRGLIQDGTVSASFLGNTYAANPGLAAQRRHNSGTPRPLSQALMNALSDDIYHAGGEIDTIRANTGVYDKFGQLSQQEKRYNIVRGGFPKFIQGWREGDLLYSYDKGTVTVKKDPQVPARTMYFLALKDTFYRHTLAEMGFLDGGGKEGVLHLTPSTGGGGYDASWTAVLYAAFNISCCAPPKNGVLEDIEDTNLAND